MVWTSFQHSRLAGATNAVRTGERHVDLILDQHIENRLALGYLKRLAGAIEHDLEAAVARGFFRRRKIFDMDLRAWDRSRCSS